MRTTTMARNLGSERVVRRLSDLKLGYLNPLNIIHERKSMSGGKTYLPLPDRKSMSGGKACVPLPISRPRSSNHSMQRVSDAMTPAAAGIGKPRNSLFAASELAAARQLKRAR